MIDWTNDQAAGCWHDWKREPLINDGIVGHWLDLDEPEIYDPGAWYAGILGDYKPLQRESDVHNLYNLLWMRSRRDELIVRVYADSKPSFFTLFEDDGETIAYQAGEVRTTLLSQQQAGDRVTVHVEGAQGTFAGALARRDNVVKLVVRDGVSVARVTLNGTLLDRYDTQAAFDAAPSGWYDAGNYLVVAKSGEMDVSADKAFGFGFGPAIYMPIIRNGG
jgi:hypothetical protein